MAISVLNGMAVSVDHAEPGKRPPERKFDITAAIGFSNSPADGAEALFPEDTIITIGLNLRDDAAVELAELRIDFPEGSGLTGGSIMDSSSRLQQQIKVTRGRAA